MEVAGEVAEAWAHWLWTAEPLPRHAELLDQRFASNEQNYEALTNLRFEKDGYGNLMVHPMVLMAVGIFMAVELRGLRCSSNLAGITGTTMQNTLVEKRSTLGVR